MKLQKDDVKCGSKLLELMILSCDIRHSWLLRILLTECECKTAINTVL
jgi:hypothetical protein